VQIPESSGLGETPPHCNGGAWGRGKHFSEVAQKVSVGPPPGGLQAKSVGMAIVVVVIRGRGITGFANAGAVALYAVDCTA
jgi:hypothetical protein